MDVKQKRSRSKQSCCVPDCNTPGYIIEDNKCITFHVLPKDEKLLKTWIVKIRRDIGPLFQITRHTRICSRHFLDSDFNIPLISRKKMIKPTAVPSVFARESRPGNRLKSRMTKKMLSTVTYVSSSMVTSSDQAHPINIDEESTSSIPESPCQPTVTSVIHNKHLNTVIMSSTQRDAILSDGTLCRQAAARADRHLATIHSFDDSNDANVQAIAEFQQTLPIKQEFNVSDNLVSNVSADIAMVYGTDDKDDVKSENWSNRMLLERIWGQVEQNTILLQSLYQRVLAGAIPTPTSVEGFGLPLDSMEGFSKVEYMLGDKTQYNRLVSHLATIGGVTAKDVISLMLVQVIKSEFATTFNWKGKNKKKGLEGTLLAHAITDAAKRSSLKEAESVAELKKWLKNAHDREGGRQKRQSEKLQKERTETQNVMAAGMDTSSGSDIQMYL